jgi:hypothetical protein
MVDSPKSNSEISRAPKLQKGKAKNINGLEIELSNSTGKMKAAKQDKLNEMAGNTSSQSENISDITKDQKSLTNTQAKAAKLEESKKFDNFLNPQKQQEKKKEKKEAKGVSLEFKPDQMPLREQKVKENKDLEVSLSEDQHSIKAAENKKDTQAQRPKKAVSKEEQDSELEYVIKSTKFSELKASLQSHVPQREVSSLNESRNLKKQSDKDSSLSTSNTKIQDKVNISANLSNTENLTNNTNEVRLKKSKQGKNEDNKIKEEEEEKDLILSMRHLKEEKLEKFLHERVASLKDEIGVNSFKEILAVEPKEASKDLQFSNESRNAHSANNKNQEMTHKTLDSAKDIADALQNLKKYTKVQTKHTTSPSATPTTKQINQKDNGMKK